MKVCPKCGQSFNDDSLKFCLLDGTPLTPGDSAPTVVMTEARSALPTQTIPLKKKRSPVLWTLLVLAMLLVGGAVLAGMLFLAYKRGQESARTDGAAVNTYSSPRTAATPRSDRQSAPASTPDVEPTPADAATSDDDADEVTPIKWATSAVEFNPTPGRSYRFHCPPDGTEGIVWGSDIYATGSSICTSAVHAGKITLGDGGIVEIEYRPGRQTYGSTVRNGITSNTLGQYPHSFVVK